MRILADMGVDTRVVEWLVQHGHDAKHLRDEGLHRMPDGEIFAKAISEDRVIMAFDSDFGEIVALSRGQKASIILFRLGNTRTPHLIGRLATLLVESTDALEKGAVVGIEESRHRVRCLPIGNIEGLRSK